MKPFSRLRWFFLCCAGLRHRKGENWFRIGKGESPRRSSRCTRCGVRGKGLAH
jgi:hypothetical protein